MTDEEQELATEPETEIRVYQPMDIAVPRAKENLAAITTHREWSEEEQMVMAMSEGAAMIALVIDVTEQIHGPDAAKEDEEEIISKIYELVDIMRADRVERTSTKEEDADTDADGAGAAGE